MPLDPRIPGLVQAEPFNGMAQLQQIREQQQRQQLINQQIRSGQAVEQARRQDIAHQVSAEAGLQTFYGIIGSSKTPEEAAARIRVEAPEHYDAFLKQRAELDDKAASIKEKGLQAAKLTAEIQAKGKEYSEPFMQLVEKSGHSPQVFDFALNTIQSHFPDFPADQYRQQAGGDPLKIKAIVDSMKSPSQQQADTSATTAAAELPGKQAASAIQQQVAAGTVGGITPEQQAVNATARGQLGVAQRRETREQKQFNATYGQPGADGSPAASPLAKAMAEYRSPPISPRSMASGPGKALMEEVLRLNPDYDATQFPTRQKTRIAFTSGPQSETISSLNTAIGHLDQFVDVAKALENGNFRPGNEAHNWLKATFGDSAPTNFEGIRGIMAGELASAFKKSGATDQEIASVQAAIQSKNSTRQLVDYATTIAIPALGSKVANRNAQYRQVMGEKDPFKVLSPDAERVLVKYGFDPAHPTMGKGTTAATGPKATQRFNPATGKLEPVP